MLMLLSCDVSFVYRRVWLSDVPDEAALPRRVASGDVRFTYINGRSSINAS